MYNMPDNFLLRVLYGMANNCSYCGGFPAISTSTLGLGTSLSQQLPAGRVHVVDLICFFGPMALWPGDLTARGKRNS